MTQPPPSPPEKDVEPRAQSGEVVFAEADFRALADPLCRDPQWNGARLAARTKLATLGKRAAARCEVLGLALDTRSSIHNPHPFNHMRVTRLWTYLMRRKADKAKLRKELGPDLAKDLDAAYRNAYLCIALEADAIEVSLRIHADAWIDATNLTRRVQREGTKPLLRVLQELGGFHLRLHDWKGEWPCSSIETSRLEEFLRFWKPGEHRFAVERRWPAPAGARAHVLGTGVESELLRELERLVPLYRHVAWSADSDYLFAT
jgi:hypothetical protein